MLAICIGAFLGPFGGNVVQVLLPVLQRWYGIELNLAALSVTAYMVPFAGGQFFSGALADRFGRKPLLLGGFAAFGIASLIGAVAPVYGVFLAARAAQGLSNAFTTPILMAVLGDSVPGHRLGRALGWFSAANTAGLFLAPMVAGSLALIDWRLVYLLLALVCTALTANYARWRPAVSAGPRTRVADESGWRGVLTPQLVALYAGAFLGYFSLNGTGFLVALHSQAAFDFNPAQAGLLLSCFGFANMVSARPAGSLVDTVGSVPVSAAGVVGAAAVLLLLPRAPGPLATGALLLAGGASVAALWAGLTKLAVASAPGRRATASSLFNAWKFVGYAVAPLLYTPIYSSSGVTVAFTLAAVLTLAMLAPLGYVWRRELHHVAA